MIEIIVHSRCTACGECVKVCPTNVFDWVDDAPRIARQSECQTCYLCELYCRADALYVAPDAGRVTGVTEADAIASETLGEYRRNSGWDEWSEVHPNLFWRQGELFMRGRRASARPAPAGEASAGQDTERSQSTVSTPKPQS